MTIAVQAGKVCEVHYLGLADRTYVGNTGATASVKRLSFARVEEFTAPPIRLLAPISRYPGFVGSDSFRVDVDFESEGPHSANVNVLP
jgi:hypothetical protein